MKVLLTRPEGSNDSMKRALNLLGVETIETPLMAIEPLAPSQCCVEQLQRAQKVIFISQHAVLHSQTLFSETELDKSFFAVGQKTAEILKQAGIEAFGANNPSQDSEGLLSLPELESVANEHIVIVRGHGGREKLASELTARGAKVHYCEVYQRVMPELDSKHVCQSWQRQGVDTMLITSGEILSNLLRLASNEQLEWLKQCRLIVPSDRVAKMAQAVGLEQVHNAGGASKSAMLSTLKQFIVTD